MNIAPAKIGNGKSLLPSFVIHGGIGQTCFGVCYDHIVDAVNEITCHKAEQIYLICRCCILDKCSCEFMQQLGSVIGRNHIKRGLQQKNTNTCEYLCDGYLSTKANQHLNATTHLNNKIMDKLEC